MVKHITSDGYLYVAGLGGIDAGVLPGSHVTIFSGQREVQGIFGRKAIHRQKAEERKSMPLDMDNMWIDIGAKNQKEAEKMVQIGDFATFRLGVSSFPNNLVCSPGIDDKAGLFVAMEALRLCAKAKLSVGLYAVSTVQEEVGLRGAKTAAYGINPEVGIGIDVTHSSDDPSATDKKLVPCKLGAGPTISRGPNTNPVVERMLQQTAKKAKIPYQIEPNTRPLGNDTNAMQVTRAGVATGSIGIPNRNMHTQVEVSHLGDLENAAKLIAAFVKSITPKTDFRPS
jgi:endoglucanase